MGDVSKGEGRTVLFVSHNMAAVKTLCNNGIVLENGMIKYVGEISKSILKYNSYKTTTKHSAIFSEISDYSNNNFKLKKITLIDFNNQELETIDENSDIFIETECMILDNINRYHFSFVFKNSENLVVFTSHNSNNPLKFGNNKIKFKIPKNFLNIDNYSISLYIIQNKQICVLYEEDFLSFNIIEASKELGGWMGKEPGFIKTNFEWYHE